MLFLAVLQPVATGQERRYSNGVFDSEGISARLVRHGCGERLYHTLGRYVFPGFGDSLAEGLRGPFTTIEKNTGVDPETVSIRPTAGTKIVESKGGMPWR